MTILNRNSYFITLYSAYNIVVQGWYLPAINSSPIAAQTAIGDLKQVLILIIERLIRVPIISIVPPGSEIGSRPIHPHLHCKVHSRSHLDHVPIYHDRDDLSLFVHLSIEHLNLYLIASCVHDHILVTQEASALALSQTVGTETSHHYSTVGAPCDGIPGRLRVTPTARGDCFKPVECVHITLALDTQ